MKQVSLAENPRILCIKLADIGDVLICTPALKALRQRYPQAKIDLLTPPSSAKVLRQWPHIDEIIVFDKFPFDSLSAMLDVRGVLKAIKFLLDLRGKRYDAVLVFHHYSLFFGSLKFAALTLATGTKLRAGVDNGKGWFLSKRVQDKGFGAMHEAEYWLQTAALVGADPTPQHGPELPLGVDDDLAVAALLEQIGADQSKPLIAVHPGAGWYSVARRWPAEHFAQLIGDLVAKRDASVLLLGGPDEQELAANVRELVAEAQRERVFNVAGQTSITGSAALIKKCQLFIGNDSGPMHIASTTGTPIVAVFGLSNWLAFGPFLPQDPECGVVVRRNLPCQPCLYRGMDLGLRDGCGTRECLTALAPASVFRAAERMLDKTSAAK